MAFYAATPFNVVISADQRRSPPRQSRRSLPHGPSRMPHNKLRIPSRLGCLGEYVSSFVRVDWHLGHHQLSGAWSSQLPKLQVFALFQTTGDLVPRPSHSRKTFQTCSWKPPSHMFTRQAHSRPMLTLPAKIFAPQIQSLYLVSVRTVSVSLPLLGNLCSTPMCASQTNADSANHIFIR